MQVNLLVIVLAELAKDGWFLLFMLLLFKCSFGYAVGNWDQMLIWKLHILSFEYLIECLILHFLVHSALG